MVIWGRIRIRRFIFKKGGSLWKLVTTLNNQAKISANYAPVVAYA